MIAKLSGILDSTSLDMAIIDVGGVGYQVFCSSRTLSACGKKGDPVSLLIDTHVREDHIHLFGFRDAVEQQWFRILTGVQGVGAKVAMSLLSAFPPDRLAQAIAAEDKACITQADGVGPKLALRIITELKDKVEKIFMRPSDVSQTPKPGKAAKSESRNTVDQDAVSALINLGYGRADAFSAVMLVKGKANDNEVTSLESLIKLALKELSA